MTITSTLLYWITRLDHVHDLINQITCGCILILIVSLCAAAFGVIESEPNVARIAKKLALVCGSLMVTIRFLAVFIPTTKELAAIQVIPLIANSQSLSNLTSSTVDLANQWLQELRPKTKESK